MSDSLKKVALIIGDVIVIAVMIVGLVAVIITCAMKVDSGTIQDNKLVEITHYESGD